MSKKVGRKREKEREDVQLGILWDVGNHGCRNIYLCIGLGLNGTRWTLEKREESRVKVRCLGVAS